MQVNKYSVTTTFLIDVSGSMSQEGANANVYRLDIDGVCTTDIDGFAQVKVVWKKPRQSCLMPLRSVLMERKLMYIRSIVTTENLGQGI